MLSSAKAKADFIASIRQSQRDAVEDALAATPELIHVRVPTESAAGATWSVVHEAVSCCAGERS